MTKESEKGQKTSADVGLGIVAEILAGLLLYGGLGWLGDHYWKTSFLLPVGLLLGLALSLYLVIKRYAGVAKE